MLKKTILLVGLGFISLLMVACSDENAMEPVPIEAGVDSCDVCHMGIEDVDAASEIILQDGTPKKFDDIGCMLTYYQENEDQVGKAFVHDHNSKEWIDMEEATFLQDRNFDTPMSYGIIAFQSADEAEAFQMENGGEVYVGVEVTNIDVEALKAMGHGESEHHE